MVVLSNSFGLLLVALFAGFVARAFYRLFWHPLASYPGPRLAAITSAHNSWFYTVGKAKNVEERLKDMHALYGPVVRLEPNVLHFSETQAYYDIYAPGSTMKKYPHFYNAFQMDLAAAGMLDNKSAKKRRDLISPLFSRRSVLKCEPLVQETVDKFVSRMSEFKADHPVNLHFALRSVSLDIITRYCFGDDMASNTLDTQEFDHPVLRSNEQRLGIFWWIMKLPFLLPFLYALPNWVADMMFESGKELRGLREESVAYIDRILKDPSQLLNSTHETIFHHIVSPQSKREGVTSRQVLINESDALVGAGTDTVGNACNIGFFHILNNPSVKKALTAELHEAWPDVEKPIGFDKLEKLPYLTAVVKETLRISHGVVTPIPRVITNPDGAVIAGHAVPAGSVVGQSVMFMHNNEEVFRNPKTFEPSRWLSEKSASMDTYLQPFSRGPRMCLGMTLAWCELYLIIATVFRKLDMELYDTTIADFTQISDHFVCNYDGRQLRVLIKSSALTDSD